MPREVAEVNIGTSTTDTVRFYCIEPNVPKAPGGVGQSVIDKAEEKANELLNRTRMDETWQKVMKSYPTTTHAHTIEYRIPDRKTLQALFDHLRDCFESQRAAAHSNLELPTWNTHRPALSLSPNHLAIQTQTFT